MPVYTSWIRESDVINIHIWRTKKNTIAGKRRVGKPNCAKETTKLSVSCILIIGFAPVTFFSNIVPNIFFYNTAMKQYQHHIAYSLIRFSTCLLTCFLFSLQYTPINHCIKARRSYTEVLAGIELLLLLTLSKKRNTRNLEQ